MIRGFTLRMGIRELRASGRRLMLFVVSVSVGVAAIVAVGGFKSDVLRSLRGQGRLLLGADLELESRFAFPPEVVAVLDSVASDGGDVAEVTAVPTMVSSAVTGRSALLTMRAVAPGYPFYGAVETEPPAAWDALAPGGGLADPGDILADPAAMTRLGAVIGDTVAIGDARFVIRGRVTHIPGDPGIRSAVNPRVYISHADLPRTGLIREGSLVTYRAFLRIGSRRNMYRFLRSHRGLLSRHAITWDTAAERERDLATAFDTVGRFLGLVGLGALLLGGIGVASAMHVYVRQRRMSAAVLRCLGASGWTLVRIYVVQAAALALIGSVLGAAVGVGLQAVIPRLLAEVLPFELEFALDPAAVLAGMIAGLWTATLFAWRAILPVRHVPALGAVRVAAIGSAGREAVGAKDFADRVTVGLIGATVVALCVWQAGALRPGLAFAAGAGITLAALAAVARLLVYLTRCAPVARLPFALRQGVANLFRPQNQTEAAIVALGFAVFIIGTIAVVEANVRDRFSLAAVGIGANLAIFDVRPDQTDQVLGLLREVGQVALDVIPIIPARLAAVQGRPVAEILASDSTGFGPPRRWALRREYRNSVRDTVVMGERVVAGEWWSEEPPGSGSPSAGAGLRVSLETEVARALRVGVGDTITWDFQGRWIDSEVASLREVDWTRLEPNFVAIFPPGSVDGVPHSDLILTNIEDADTRAIVQDRVATMFPGALVLDLTSIQETIGRILDRAALATRFMGAFTLFAGLLILAGTVVASRGLRLRENALLRALGASSRTLRGILVTEFLALGGLAGMTGVLLASASGWALSRWVFEMPFTLPLGALAALWAGAAVITLVLGMLGSRAVVRPSPLAAIRRAEALG